MTWKPRLCAAALLALSPAIPAVGADAILDLILDDPQGLVGEGGIAAVGPEFARSTATIASGNGGRALPQIAGKAAEGGGDGVSFRVLRKPEMGVPGFLRVAVGTNPAVKSAGVGVLPATAENALSALVTNRGETLGFEGSFDFLFRVGGDGGDVPPKFSVWSKVGPLTLVLEPGAAGTGLTARITSTGEKILTKGAAPRGGVSTRNTEPVPIERDEVYHAAVVFRTDAEGWSSLQVFLKKGAGAIAVGDGDGLNASIEAFKVAGGTGESDSSGKIALNLARVELPQQLDVGTFRILRSAGATIPAAGP